MIRHNLVALALMGLAGCGPSDGPIPVRGTIQSGGAPLHYGMLMFQPVPGGSGRPGVGYIGPDGQFAASTFKENDGLMPGEYRVAVQPAKPLDYNGPGENPAIASRFLSATTSGLTVSVSRSEKVVEVRLEMMP